MDPRNASLLNQKMHAHIFMDKFSERLNALDNAKAELVKSTLLPWHNYFPHGYSLVELPDERIGICTKIDVDSGTNSPLLVGEPVVIGIRSENIEIEAPYVFPDRLDFPFESFPHVNFSENNLPPTLCLSRESIKEWYAEHTFGEFISEISNWLNDAANDNLMKLKQKDGYEPFRVENFSDVFFVFPGRLDDLIVKSKTVGCFYLQFDSFRKVYTERSFVKKDTCNSLGLELVLFLKSENIKKTWFLHYPQTLAELLAFANDNGFVINEEKICKIINNPLSKVEKIIFRFAFIRPANIIGKDSPVDYLCFSVATDDFVAINVNDAKVEGVLVLEMLTPNYINELTQTSKNISNKKILLLGCGAIGSKMIFHLYRSGITNLTICDKDSLMLHNVCRHALTCVGGFENKAELIRKELNLLRYIAYPVKTVTEDLLSWLPKSDLSEYDLIIDTAASASVSRCVDRISHSVNAPIVRFVLSDSGNVGLVYVNYNRKAMLSDYYMQLVRMALDEENEEIVEWLSNERRYNYDYVRVGEGCHSNTMKLNDDVISAHTALASNIIRHIFDVPQTNAMFLSFANVDYQGSLFSTKYVVTDFFALRCKNDENWEVRIPTDILKRIQTGAKVGGNKETGGYMMGCVDNKYHRIYVLDTFTPKGSKQKSNRLELSRKGWNEHRAQVKKLTSDIMMYIGDWHSHPRYSLNPSPIDDETNNYLINNEIESSRGVCLITNTNETNAYLL